MYLYVCKTWKKKKTYKNVEIIYLNLNKCSKHVLGVLIGTHLLVLGFKFSMRVSIILFVYTMPKHCFIQLDFSLVLGEYTIYYIFYWILYQSLKGQNLTYWIFMYITILVQNIDFYKMFVHMSIRLLFYKYVKPILVMTMQFCY